MNSESPPSELQIWNEVIKGRKVGSAYRKQALGGLHTNLAESSTDLSCAHYTSASQSTRDLDVVIEETSKTSDGARIEVKDDDTNDANDVKENDANYSSSQANVANRTTSHSSKSDADTDTDLSDYRIRRTKRSREDYHGKCKRKKHR